VRLSTFADLDRSTKVSAGGAGTPQRTAARLEPTSRNDAARHAIFDPAPTESLTFSAAIDQLALSFGRQGGVDMRVTTMGVARTLTNVQHGMLLRVAQEALLNVSQHAHAHTVLMTIMFEPSAVTLAVQDDGVGLLDGTYERPGMHALRAIRYRLAELDGQLSVFESESGGVTVRATLPIE
jgi:signal transduction histidine kinase